MNQNNKGDFYNPIYWGIGIFILGLGFMIAGYFMFPENTNFPWLISSGLLLLFSIFTNIFNIQNPDYNTYVKKGVLSFAALFLGFKYLAGFFSGLEIQHVPAYKTIYFVILLAYISILAICVFIRNILRKIKERDEKEHGV